MENPNVKFIHLLEHAPPTVILQILLNLPQDDLINFAAVNTRVRNIFRQPNTKYEYYKRAPILKINRSDETKLYLSIKPDGFLHVKREFHLDGKDIKEFGDRVLYLDREHYYSNTFPNLKKDTFYYSCLKSQNNYKDGKKHGKQYQWNYKGQIVFEANYKNGKRDGKEYGWNVNGQKQFERNYKDGQLMYQVNYREEY